jgi:uncharacterized protein (DUF302 family)
MKANQIVIEHKSKFGFEKTVQILTENAEKSEWKVPFVHDLQQSLAKSGKSVKPVKVIEICKPEYSGKMLELNAERIISVMMPCRISVYEKDDGATYVSLINVEAMSSNLPSNIASVMKKASDDTFNIVGSVI